MIEGLSRFTKKYLSSIKGYFDTGSKHREVFKKLKEIDSLTSYSLLRGGLQKVKRISEQAAKFKYIRKGYKASNRFFSLADRYQKRDRRAFFRAFGKIKGTDHFVTIYIEIKHNLAEKLTREQLEEKVREQARKEVPGIDTPMLEGEIKVTFDYGVRKNPKYKVGSE